MLQKGLLIIISGPSGAGKGTLCRALISKNDRLKLSVSCTTRQPRNMEKEGVNYFFVTVDKFNEMVKSGDLLEYAEVYGNYYGTPRSFVDKNLNEGYDVILEIDIQGALKVKEKYPEGVFVFILPPSMEELKNRIKKRGSETEESLLKRFKSAFQEINYISKYNYVIINDVVENAVEKIESIITAEKCRVDRIKETDIYLKLQEGCLDE